MKKCNRKNMGLLFVILGAGIVVTIVLPAKILAFLLAAIIIYAGFVMN